MSGPPSRFKYAPLRGREIRLLTLPTHTTALSADYALLHFPLDTAGSYEAISYTWDGNVTTSEISLNGEPFPTTTKVQQLLRALASATTAKRVWIDFICINQSDTNEKSQQVDMMKDIFEGAHRVTAWLGHQQDASLAKEMVADILTRSVQRNPGFGIYATYTQQRYRPFILALKRLFRNPWFRRMWVIQEVVVANELNIVCGGETFAWEELVRVSRAMSSSHEFLAVLQGTADPGMMECGTDLMFNCELTSNIKTFYKASNRWPLSLALDTGRQFQATDPRDMVYAALGFTREAKNPGLKPDYTKSAEDVFVSAAKCMYSSSRESLPFTLRLLLPCAGIGHPRKLTLPSWVPDWSGQRSPAHASVDHVYIQTLGPIGAYRATLDFQPTIEILSGCNVMKIQGFCVDEIVEVGSVYDIPFGADMSISRADAILYTTAWFRSVLDIAHRRAGSPYPTDIQVEDAIWRTLVCDLHPKVEGQSAPDELRVAYRYWKRSLDNYFELEKKYDRERVVAALDILYEVNGRRVRGEATSQPLFELACSASQPLDKTAMMKPATDGRNGTTNDNDTFPYCHDGLSGWERVDRILSTLALLQHLDKVLGYCASASIQGPGPGLDLLRSVSIALMLFLMHDVNTLEHTDAAVYRLFTGMEPVPPTPDTAGPAESPGHSEAEDEGADSSDAPEPKRLERVMSVLNTLVAIDQNHRQSSPQEHVDFLPATQSHLDPEILFSMFNAAIRPSYMRSFFATRRGYIGLGPAYSKPGDRVCLVAGVAAPYIIRMSQGGDFGPFCGELVGEAYVHGIMNGEMMDAGKMTSIYLK
ncbi:hypothetical protein OQA88_3230 [Cercophora sp. LCS_1]